jgi:hypothetical protein
MAYYELYRASVVKNPTTEDPRTVVRVLGLMDDIAKDTDLPKYPSFFANRLFNLPLKSIVWCVCNDTFDIGYVLGPSNVFSEAVKDYSSYSTIEESFLNVLKNSLSGIKLGLPNFQDLYFSYVDNNIIEAISTKTGLKITYHSNGALFMVGPVGIVMSYANGLISIAKNATNGTSEINISADSIRIKGAVSLGTGPNKMYVLASKTKDAYVSMSDGSVARSSDSVVI